MTWEQAWGQAYHRTWERMTAALRVNDWATYDRLRARCWRTRTHWLRYIGPKEVTQSR